MIQKFRCHQCNKLLAEQAASGTIIKCVRCHSLNEVE